MTTSNNGKETAVLGTYLRTAETSPTVDTYYLGGPKRRGEIERVNIINTGVGNHKSSDANCWSVAQDGSENILAWWEDQDSDNYAEITIASKARTLIANEDSNYLFYMIGYNGDDTVCINGIGNLDTSNVKYMNSMFGHTGYKSMTSLNLGANFDTSNVKNMNQMFYNCGYTAMTSLNLGTNFDTSKVENMTQMFSHCGYTELISLNLGTNFDTSIVENMSYMFSNCGYTKMASLNLGTNFDTSSVEDMNNMFRHCGHTEMTSLNLGSDFITTSVADMSNMFYGCGTNMNSLDISAMTFNHLTSSDQYTDIFKYCGVSACSVLVKDATAQTFVRTNKNTNWSDSNITIKSI